jgi:hypothetical protein
MPSALLLVQSVPVHDALDELTVTYVLAARPHFENLRQIAAQLAGLLVLASTGASSAAPDHPLLHSAETLFQESIDGIRRTRTTDRALCHHQHLTRAAAALKTALSAARDRLGRPDGRTDLDPIMIPLRAGYSHLQDAANALPGFEMVAFEQGCCGSRIGPALPAHPAFPTLSAPEAR